MTIAPERPLSLLDDRALLARSRHLLAVLEGRAFDWPRHARPEQLELRHGRRGAARSRASAGEHLMMGGREAH